MIGRPAPETRHRNVPAGPGERRKMDEIPMVEGRPAICWRPWLKRVLFGIAAAIALACGLETGRVLFGRNLHIVIPGRVYRCAQPSGAELERIVKQYGIRTVINLRGCSAAHPWYLEECRTTQQLEIAQEDICLSSGRLPSTSEIRRLVEVLDRCEYPVLLHCRRGADRTGLAS